MSAFLTYVLPALLPALADGFRGLFARLTNGKGALPQNIDEVIKLMNAQTDRVKALADIDKPTGDTSVWVNNIRALYRYAMITIILLTTIFAVFTKQDVVVVAALLDMSGASMSFIVGERMYLGLKK